MNHLNLPETKALLTIKVGSLEDEWPLCIWMISPTRLMAVNQSEKPRLNQFNDLYVNEESSVIDQGFSENWGGGGLTS